MARSVIFVRKNARERLTTTCCESCLVHEELQNKQRRYGGIIVAATDCHATAVVSLLRDMNLALALFVFVKDDEKEEKQAETKTLPAAIRATAAIFL